MVESPHDLRLEQSSVKVEVETDSGLFGGSEKSFVGPHRVLRRRLPAFLVLTVHPIWHRRHQMNAEIWVDMAGHRYVITGCQSRNSLELGDAADSRDVKKQNVDR